MLSDRVLFAWGGGGGEFCISRGCRSLHKCIVLKGLLT